MTSFKHKIFPGAAFVFFTFFLASLNPANLAASDPRIAVLLSYSGAPFQETLSGFQQYLRKQGVQVGYEIYPLEGEETKATQSMQEIKKSKVNLLFTLGSLATETALRETPDLPVIASMVLRTESLQRAPNATGVVLEFPLETQFKWLKRFLPEVRRVGVIYSAENQERVEAAVKVAQRMGLRMESSAIRTPQDLPPALETLANNVEVIWGVADRLVLNPQTAKHILLFSFRNLIPFIGLSDSWVKAGALYSMDWDYPDLGMQCGEMALKVLQGIKVNTILPASPRRALYSLNLKTARHMKLNLSEALVRDAHRVF